MKKAAKVLAVIFGVLMIAAGISCLFQPAYTSLILGYALGLSMVFDAVGGFIYWHNEKKEGNADGWMLTSAILSAVFGFFILNNIILKGIVDLFIIYYFAVWLLCHGILDIVLAFRIRRFHKNFETKKVGTRWYIRLCLGILICAFGVICLVKPLIMASIIGVFIGLGIISAGANMITLATTPEK